MTNFEKYKDDLLKIEGDFAVDKNTEEIVRCNLSGGVIDCVDCVFNKGDCFDRDKIEWLYEEHKEPILSGCELDLIKAFNKATGKEWKFIGKNFREVILFTDEPLIQNSVFGGCEFKKEKGAWLHMSGNYLFSNLACDVDECVLYDVKNKDYHKYK